MKLNTVNYQHSDLSCTGILLTNLGSPDEATTPAVRRYLNEFLSDPRITELPRWFWWLILHGIILRIRPARSAKLYAKIWTEEGSPLIHYSQQQAAAVEATLQEQINSPIKIALGMRYGNPSIASALDSLQQAGANQILILPL